MMMPLNLPAGLDHPQWLSLLQAARILGVHPATLRRWADAGEIPVMLTPGGHRRFSSAEIHRFEQARSERRELRSQKLPAHDWAKAAADRTRREIQAQAGLPWLQHFAEPERETWRALGRRLLGVIITFISLPEDSDSLLDEARQIGAEYARLTRALGLPASVALQAAQFFRDSIVETALSGPAHTRLQPNGNARTLRRISTVLNTVEISIAESYENEQG